MQVTSIAPSTDESQRWIPPTGSSVVRASRTEQLTVVVYVRASIASARPSPDLAIMSRESPY